MIVNQAGVKLDRPSGGIVFDGNIKRRWQHGKIGNGGGGFLSPIMPPALLQPAWQIIHMAGGFKQALAFTGKAAHDRIGKPA